MGDMSRLLTGTNRFLFWMRVGGVEMQDLRSNEKTLRCSFGQTTLCNQIRSAEVTEVCYLIHQVVFSISITNDREKSADAETAESAVAIYRCHVT